MIPFSGYEEEVYRVDRPDQLPGKHAPLIAAGLRPGEAVQHLLFCPIWDSTTRPFGVGAPRASHALCLTPDRLLISRDYHRRAVEPTTFSIPRDALVGFEFGQAILMSWLAFYVRSGEALGKEEFYFPRHGNHHVARLLRSCRESWPSHRSTHEEAPGLSWREVLGAAGYFHERLLQPLLLAGEACVHSCQRSPVWGRKRAWLRTRPIGLAHWGTLLLTDRAFFHVWGQPPLGKQGYVFGHNVFAFSRQVPLAATHQGERVAGVACVRLVLTFGGEGSRRLEILFPSEQAAMAARWAQDMTTELQHQVLLTAEKSVRYRREMS